MAGTDDLTSDRQIHSKDSIVKAVLVLEQTVKVFREFFRSGATVGDKEVREA